ncbi:MAG TPA: uracil-DNA glycosylase [Thermoplasmata archaeon]|nr:uracil-DNA glycosylase [Thermoplasmata archaeon]
MKPRTAPSPADSLRTVTEEVIACRRCPRLVEYRERVARERKKAFRDETYWGRPVPGFGDPKARLVVIGLAPAAHGSNRTGRVFTGDRSAAFLVRALFRAGFANQPTSDHRGDGLRYQDAYVTAGVRCVPPDNRPLPLERDRCAPYLDRELRLLSRARGLLALGGFAWEATLDGASRAFGTPRPTVEFRHAACAPLGPGKPIVWGSYHPSPQNTNTGKLTEAMFSDLLRSIRASWGG